MAEPKEVLQVREPAVKRRRDTVKEVIALVICICSGGVVDYILEACMPAKIKGVAKILYKTGALFLGLFTADKIFDSVTEQFDMLYESFDQAREEDESNNDKGEDQNG